MESAPVIDVLGDSSPEINKKIENFKKNYLDSFGILTLALKESGLSEAELSNWMTDLEFAGLYEKALDARHDFVESKLLDLIESGDPTAIIFYCSTVLKNRGYKK